MVEEGAQPEVAGLPPRPDQHGRPQPPRALRVAAPWTTRGTVRSSIAVGSDSVDPPDGPVLESVSAPRRHLWSEASGGAFAGGIFATAATLITAVFAPGELPLAELPRNLMVFVPAVAAVGFVVVVSFGRNQQVQAGATWVGDVYTGIWVGVYALATIAIVETRAGPELRLTDCRDRHVRLPCGLLQANQRLWDLVYNGIRHSAAAGAQVDGQARRQLGLG